jgi:hypothetical protein
MDTPPFTQEGVAVRGHLGEQAPHIRPLDADAEHELRRAIGAQQIDLRLSCPVTCTWAGS